MAPAVALGAPHQAGLRGVARVDKLLGPQIPTLFLFGARKPFMFHSRAWLDRLTATPGNRVLGLPTGHWVMVRRPQEFNAAVLAWLAETAPAAAR